MSKCDFNKVQKQLYWNRTSASCKFAAYFQNTFSKEHLWSAASEYYFINLETKLKTKFLFSCHVDRSHVMCSSVRRANSIDSIRRLPVKAYLSQSSNLIFKHLGFECQVKLIFFSGLLFWASSQFKYSRTLSETIDKWVLLMWGVRTIWGAIIADETTKLKICIPMWPMLLHNWSKDIMRPRVTFLKIFFDASALVYICLHSSSDSSTLV